jgi:hypothetical protein
MFSTLVTRLGLWAAGGALAVVTALGGYGSAIAFADSTGNTSTTPPAQHRMRHEHECRHLEWPCFVQGEPRFFHAGGRAGFYIWHNANEDTHWHVETTDPKGVSHVYTGTLTTDGKFVNLVNVRPEGDDTITQTGDGTITFRLHTFDGIDGLKFSVDGGQHLTMDLQVDGAEAATNMIYLGRHRHHPAAVPFTFNR